MKTKDYLKMLLPVPKYYVYKGRETGRKTVTQFKAYYPINRMPHPIATELHGVYLKKEDIPEMDEIFDPKDISSN